MWDGDTCPCETFGIDPDDLPTDGVFAITWPDDGRTWDQWPTESEG